MFTRNQLIAIILTSQNELPDSIVKVFELRFLKMNEQDFIEEFENTTGIKIEPVIRNRYFIK